MCKIITLTNITKVKSLNKLTKIACELVSATERDGFGYTIQGDKGNFGERTTSPRYFSPSLDKPISKFPYVEATYNRFGEVGKAIGAAQFHGRTSTNDRTLLNTHPINKHGFSLIHNGVVNNHGPEYERITSNDTEDLVHYMATTGIKGITENLTGYYAFSAFDAENKHHIVRDSIANLYMAEIPGIKSYIFATSEGHIKQLCDQMKWKFSVPQPVQNNMHLIFEHGVLTYAGKITPRGRTEVESRFASLSLGYELDTEVKSEADWLKTSLTEDEDLFLTELEESGDESYYIKNKKGEVISYAIFKTLDTNEKLLCEVVRPDGTIVDQDNYASEKLYYSKHRSEVW